MPVAKSKSRVALRAFESTRRFSWHAVVHQAVGVSAELLIVVGFVAAGWLERRALAQEKNQQAAESVSFLAPFRR